MKKELIEFTSFEDLSVVTFDGEYLHVFESIEKKMLLITKDVWFKLQEEFFELKSKYYKNYNKSYCGSECISFFGKESKRKTSYLTSWTKEDEDDVDNMKPVYEKIPLLVVTEFELEMEHG